MIDGILVNVLDGRRSWSELGLRAKFLLNKKERESGGGEKSCLNAGRG